MFLNRIKIFWQQSAIRLTLSLLGVFLVVTALAGLVTYQLVQRSVNNAADARLLAQATLIEAALREGTELPAPAFGQEYMVQTKGGRSGTLPFAYPSKPDGFYYFDRPGRDYRYLVKSTSSGAQLVISENLERQDELLDTLSGGLQISAIGALIAGLFAGLWFALRSQRRMDLISRGLEDVAQGLLDTRIALPGNQDDLSVLASRINTTTDQLARSMEQMRVQSSNIAHDLRTPLARLRANVETSLNALTEQGKAVDADTLSAALDQIDRIVDTFNALLRLSQIESGAGKSAFAPVDLQDLVDHVAVIYAPVVEHHGQSLAINLRDPAQIHGDRDLLIQLLANLIQNALRYGNSGETITLQVQGPVLSVKDQGPGIPFDEREKVLQPLYQLEKARQNEGFGLGLSMVAAISKLHDARLSLSDGDDGSGLAVTLRFPRLTNL